KLLQRLETRSVLDDETAIDPALLDQEAGDAVEENQVGLGMDRQVRVRRHRRLGLARVDDDDLGIMAIPADALPQNRVGDAQVGSDQDDDVRFLEIAVGVWRSVEAKRLLVSHDSRGHALPSVAVSVYDSHAELG